MSNTAIAHTEKYPVFLTNIVHQSSNITTTFSFINTDLTGGHKTGPLNFGVSRCSNSNYVCWHTTLLEDVSITVMTQVDEAFLGPALSSTSW